MSNDESTRGSGGGRSHDRDRLPPYAPIPAGWVLPEDTGAIPVPETADNPEYAAPITADPNAVNETADANEAAPSEPEIPDPMQPADASDAPPVDAPQVDSDPAPVVAQPGDLDTDMVTAADVEELPIVDDTVVQELAAADPLDAEIRTDDAATAPDSTETSGLAWGAVAPTDAADEYHAPSPADELETTVLPVVAVDPSQPTRTEAIAGLVGDKTPDTSESDSDPAQPVASDADAADSATALAGTEASVPSRVSQNRGKDPIRTIARGIGQTLITLGVVVLLFVVYEVYVTDLFGDQKQAAVSEALDERWQENHAAETTASPPSEQSSAAETTEPPAPAAQVVDPAERVRNYDTVIGEGFAKIFIPALGSDYVYTIVEGTTVEDLYGSPGHYEDTQYPGEVGNFAVAGHRVSKGSPFNALGTLSSCDSIVIETQDDWFVYRILPMEDEMAAWNPDARPLCAGVAPLDGEYAGLPGREITLPSDYAQVLPVPRVNAAGPEALAAATQRIITLTTCHPQFSDAERMIVHGVLIKSYAKADGFVPPELNEV